MEKYSVIKEIHNGESADLFEVQDSKGNFFIKKQLKKMQIRIKKSGF